MKKRTFLATLLASAALCGVALAANVVSAIMIPDGTYTAKVLQVLDAKHVSVALQNGVDTTLAAGRPSIDFSKIHTNDSVKFSLSKGQVLAYHDLSSH